MYIDISSMTTNKIASKPRNFLIAPSKGQLISKCLFGVFNSPKKRTKTIRLEVTK